MSAKEIVYTENARNLILAGVNALADDVRLLSVRGADVFAVRAFVDSDLLPAIEIALARYAQIVTLEEEVSDLVERFETRKIVDRAKGLLNEKMGLSEPEAFRWIQKASMDRRLTMHDVAVAIIDQLSPKKSSPAAKD